MVWQKRKVETKKIGFRTLVFKTYEMPDGSTKEFTTYGAEGVKGAAVIALTPDRKVIVARQYRPGPEKVMDELPGGIVDEGEDPKITAARELLEETGYKTGHLKELGVAYRDAYSNESSYYFMAYDCEKVAEQQLEAAEFIEVAEISIDELLQAGRDGRLTDAAALFLAQDELQALNATA